VAPAQYSILRSQAWNLILRPHAVQAQLPKLNVKILWKIILGAVALALLWPASRLMIASFNRTEPPSRIISEAAVYLVVMFLICRIYRKL